MRYELAYLAITSTARAPARLTFAAIAAIQRRADIAMI